MAIILSISENRKNFSKFVRIPLPKRQVCISDYIPCDCAQLARSGKSFSPRWQLISNIGPAALRNWLLLEIPNELAQGLAQEGLQTAPEANTFLDR